MKKSIALALCASVMAVHATAAQAGGPGFARAAMRHCGGDVARLCSSVFPGGGRIAQCLLDQFEDLSPTCSTFVAQARAAQKVLFSCQADAERYCEGVAPGGGRIVACLDDNRDVISRSCRRALNRAETALRP